MTSVPGKRRKRRIGFTPGEPESVPALSGPDVSGGIVEQSHEEDPPDVTLTYPGGQPPPTENKK